MYSSTLPPQSICGHIQTCSPGLGRVDAGGLLAFEGSQPSFRFSARFHLKEIRWTVREDVGCISWFLSA